MGPAPCLPPSVPDNQQVICRAPLHTQPSLGTAQSARPLSSKEGPPGGENFGDSHGKCPSRWASLRAHKGEKPL